MLNLLFYGYGMRYYTLLYSLLLNCVGIILLFFHGNFFNFLFHLSSNHTVNPILFKLWLIALNSVLVKLGSVITDFENPDMVVIGASDEMSNKLIEMNTWKI